MLAACSDEAAAPVKQARDPQVAQALDDPLMTDPDLSSRNEGAAALTVTSDASVPVLPATAEAIAGARAEAEAAVGGAERMTDAPPSRGNVDPLSDDSPRSHVAVLPGGARCTDRLRASAIWAARLPSALAVYPRGATLASAGSDAAGCRVRAVTFSTPVASTDVLAFYWTRLGGARSGVLHRSDGAGHVLIGRIEDAAYDLRLRPDGAGTVVRLATIEG